MILAKALKQALALLLALGILPSALAAEYFDSYSLSPSSPSLDLGAQPLGYPSGVISSVMQRDRILRQALKTLGTPLEVHNFRRGADMLDLLTEKKLDAGLLGDMPTLLAAAHDRIWIAGLVKQTTTSLVSRNATRPADLAGKTIGYVPFSSAHYTLLQGLAAAGLKETQVKLLALPVDQLPEALARGEIDAFAAWEPATSLALTQGHGNRVVFRGQSTDYFVIEKSFERSHPEAARTLVAGFLRAVEWLKRSMKNQEKAAAWVMEDGRQFARKPAAVSVNQIASITRRDLLDIPSAPVVIISPGTEHPLQGELDFLQRQGKMSNGKAESVSQAFAYHGLAQVWADPVRYTLETFNYEE